MEFIEDAFIEDALAFAGERLRAAGIDQPRREACLLLGKVVGANEAWVLAHGEQRLENDQQALLSQLIRRRELREPVAYLFGTREFYGRNFRVDSRVLIPRPETEHLVERALELDLPEGARVLEIGTGSGCIAITLALEKPGWQLVATDLSPEALAVAKTNRELLGASSQVKLLAADSMTAFREAPFDLVVSNPPYIAERDFDELPPDVRDFEPGQALVAGPEGLDVYRSLFEAAARPRRGTPFLLEIGSTQAPDLEKLAASFGLQLVEVHEDLAGRPRLVELIS